MSSQNEIQQLVNEADSNTSTQTIITKSPMTNMQFHEKILSYGNKVSDILNSDEKFQNIKNDIFNNFNLVVQKEDDKLLVFNQNNNNMLLLEAKDENNQIKITDYTEQRDIQYQQTREENEQEPKKEKEEKKKISGKKIALIIILVLLTLALIGLAIFLIMKNKKNKDSKDRDEEQTKETEIQENKQQIKIDLKQEGEISVDKNSPTANNNQTITNKFKNDNNQTITVETEVGSTTTNGMELTKEVQDAITLETNPNALSVIKTKNNTTINNARNVQVDGDTLYYDVNKQRYHVKIDDISYFSNEKTGILSQETLKRAGELSPNNSGGITFTDIHSTVQIPDNNTAIFRYRNANGDLIAIKEFQNMSQDSLGTYYSNGSPLPTDFNEQLKQLDIQLDHKYINTKNEPMFSLQTLQNDKDLII